MYRTHFEALRIRQLDEHNRLLREAFRRVYNKADLVLSDAELLLIRCSLTVGGGAYLGSIPYPLGGLLEAWHTDESMRFPVENGYASLCAVSGSPLSGTCSVFGWSPSDGAWVSKKTIGFGKWYKKLKDISDRYPQRLNNDTRAIARLLRELK